MISAAMVHVSRDFVDQVLSMNNIGLGFAGGVAGLEYGWVALSVAGFSVTLCVWASG